jgi:cytochrome P450
MLKRRISIMISLDSLRTVDDVQKLYQWFDQMRTTQPVWMDESSKCWHVFRYEDVRLVLNDYSQFSADIRALTPMRPISNKRSSAFTVGFFLSVDPPQHNLLRGLVTSAFSSQAIAQLAGRVEEIAQSLLDKVRHTGKMEFIDEFAYLLPVQVISELLGMPTDEWYRCKRWTDELLAMQVSDAQMFSEKEPESYRRGRQSAEEMADYFENMVEERRRHPRQDVISGLAAAEIEGRHLSNDELISFCFQLYLAGYLTTTSILGHMIACLDAHPEVTQHLLENPDDIPVAIEEALRFSFPAWRMIRVTTKDVPMNGVTIPAGSVVMAWIASANRDPEQFSHPERFDITRKPNRHLSFGHGIHYCIGAPLNRLEVSIALRLMLKQLPNLRRANKEPLELLDGRRLVYGIKHLPIVFDPS